MFGIYLHIPFCRQACSYCNFFFSTRQKYRPDFVEQLLAEIKSYRDSAFGDDVAQTIYFGGGTPSQLSLEEVRRIMDTLGKVFNLQPEETTFEVNPDDVSPDYLQGLRDLGINRLSMGVQTFDSRFLTMMNRAHTRREAEDSIRMIRETGFDTFNVDLMYALPGQTMDQLLYDLDHFISFRPPHLSAYALTVEPRTRLGKQIELGRLPMPDDDLGADMMEKVRRSLEANEIRQYEVSNFALEGHQALHNHRYWEHVPYLGLGPGAHSFAWRNGRPDELGMRWWNRADLKSYLDEGGWEQKRESEVLDLKKLGEERAMLGLRTLKGVTFKELKDRYGYQLNNKQQQFLEHARSMNWLEDSDRLCCTSDGLKRADALALELLGKG